MLLASFTPQVRAQTNSSYPYPANTNMNQYGNGQAKTNYNYYTPNTPTPANLNPEYAYNRALQSSQGYAPALNNSNLSQPGNMKTAPGSDLKNLRQDFSKGLKANQDNSIKVPALLLSTTPSLEGYRIKKYIGMVQGVMVREPNMYQNIQTSLTTFMNAGGGSLNSYIEMCAQTRQDALDSMVLRASKLGANAVLSIRYNDSSVSVSKDQFATEVACYGTAVVVEKIK